MVKANKWFTWIVFCSINILILEDDMKKSYYFQSDGDGGILKFFFRASASDSLQLDNREG